jgi:hypothetical protein
MFRSPSPEQERLVDADERSPEEAARNEAVFRDANEQIDGRRQELDIEGAAPYLCECEDPRCTQALQVTPEEYERVRRDSRTFLVAPGHDTSSGRILERHEGYWVALKEGIAGEVARALDPRSRQRSLTADRRGR